MQTTRSDSLYQSVMGDRFACLDPAVQAFHGIAGEADLRGAVRIAAPDGWIARCFGQLLGTPVSEQSGPLRFELVASATEEVWTRHFPAHMTCSRLVREGEWLREDLGVATLWFELTERNGRLAMVLVRMKFLGLPCPPGLLPLVSAEEWGTEGRFHFAVSARLPGGALVAGYEGHLDLVPREAGR